MVRIPPLYFHRIANGKLAITIRFNINKTEYHFMFIGFKLIIAESFTGSSHKFLK